ncbi:MAG: hypothetical protein ACJZ78_01850 [Prochlorococcus marinus]
MSREQTRKQDQISIFGEIAKGCRTDDQKIEFFDSSKEAFFTDSMNQQARLMKISLKT